MKGSVENVCVCFVCVCVLNKPYTSMQAIFLLAAQVHKVSTSPHDKKEKEKEKETEEKNTVIKAKQKKKEIRRGKH